MDKNKKVEHARKILGLGKSATIPEIKKAYRRLSLEYHPDKCGEENKAEYEKKFKEINNANKALMDYCLSYRISFSGSEAQERINKKMKDHMRRFYDGWWADLGEDHTG